MFNHAARFMLPGLAVVYLAGCSPFERANPYDPESADYIDRNTTVEMELLGLKGISTINEGSEVTVLLRLLQPPLSESAVTVSSSHPALQVAGTETLNLLFTPENYDSYQQFNLTAVEDDDLNSETVFLRIVSDVLETAQYSFTVNDNDSQQLSVTGPGRIDEGSSGEIRFKLKQKPAAPVTISIESDSPALVSADGQATSLVINPEDYGKELVALLFAPEDNNRQSESVAISMTADNADWKNQALTIETRDNDPLVQFSALSAELIEQQSAQFSLSLAENPGREVIFVLSTDLPDSIDIFPAVISFNESNYLDAKTITLNALDDSNTISEQPTISISDQTDELGSQVDTVPFVGGSFKAAVIDNDVQLIMVNGDDLVYEGGTVALQVRLLAEPAGPVSVNVVSSNTAAVTVSGSPLSFNSADFSEEQTITLNGLEDADDTSNPVNITFSATGVDDRIYTVTTTDNDVTIELDGDIGFTDPAETVNIIEDIETTIYARLSGNPGVSVTVHFGVEKAIELPFPDIGESVTESLAFSTANATTPQVVRLRGLSYKDSDYGEGFSARAYGYDAGGNAVPLSPGNYIVYYKDNFWDHGNGTVEQQHYGYMWKRCPQGANDDATCSGSYSSHTFCSGMIEIAPGPTVIDNGCTDNNILDGSGISSTYNTCEALNTAGYAGLTTWRVPSTGELLDMRDTGNFHTDVLGNSRDLPIDSTFWSNEDISTGFQAYALGYDAFTNSIKIFQKQYNTAAGVRCISTAY